MKDNLGQCPYVSHALPRFSPLVCPDQPVHVCKIMTPWSIWAAMSLVSWFLRISIVWFFSCQCIATHSDKPSSFCPGLGPAQGLCWFPVAEDGCSLTSCPGLFMQRFICLNFHQSSFHFTVTMSNNFIDKVS